MLKLAISGCHGRMGQRITALAQQDKDLQVETLLEHPDHPKSAIAIDGIPVHADNTALDGCQALIEFTLPDGTMTNLDAAVKYGVPMVIGTTGFSEEQIAQIHTAAKTIPIVLSSNMSVGVNLFFKLTETAAQKTGQAYTMTIEEAHHVHKKDAPSGTAKTIADVAEKASGQKVADIKSIRDGEIVGDHTITFESGEDVITLTHHAKNRDIFAKGALVAAKYLSDKTKGLYSMQDVLGLT